MQINVAEYESITYSNLGITMEFDLKKIKKCFMKDGIFKVIRRGVSIDFLASKVQFNKKA